MKIKSLLKDVVCVKHITSPITSTVLVIPETAKEDSKITPVQAVVVLIGSKCKLPIKKGDKVLVPFHLGNRQKDGTIFYDSEDVLALIDSSE